jgi:hypothetical protein
MVGRACNERSDGVGHGNGGRVYEPSVSKKALVALQDDIEFVLVFVLGQAEFGPLLEGFILKPKKRF